MKLMKSLPGRLRTGLGFAVVAAGIYCVSIAFVTGADTKAPAKPAPKKLDGAQLYSVHCSRCHTERYPTEHTAAEWKTLLMHMRVRANLPASQSKAILKYLQEEAGS